MLSQYQKIALRQEWALNLKFLLFGLYKTSDSVSLVNNGLCQAYFAVFNQVDLNIDISTDDFYLRKSCF